MEKFELYAEQNGVKWYRCKICYALSRGLPQSCPVCNSIEKTDNTETISDKSLDDRLNEYKKILDKYQNL